MKYPTWMSIMDKHSRVPFIFYWADGFAVKAIDDTGAYEMDNGLELDNPNYMECYGLAVRILEVIASADSTVKKGDLMEISELEEPLEIRTLDGKVIWQRGDSL